MKITTPILTSTILLLCLLIINSCSSSKKADPAPAKSSEKSIISFSIATPAGTLTGTISGAAITFLVPSGTNVTALVPTITLSPKATITPNAGVAQDFTKSVIYTVTAEDGTTQAYTVTVNLGKSSVKAITAFSFAGLSPIVTATIDETAKTIKATVPALTNVTTLVPTITASANAKVSPASATAQDFSKDVSYTVTAEDGSTQVYKVTVTVAPAVTVTIDCGKVPAILTDLGEGVDYIIKCNIPLSGSSTVLTINPGVTIQFDGVASGITITNGAALKMVGTAAKPILLEGKTATPGAWTGIQIDSKNTENQWQYVTIQHAGGGKYAAGLLISDYAYFLHDTQISIKNCTFTNNTGYGIWDADNGFSYARTVFRAFESNTFSKNTLSGLNITIDGIGKLDVNSHYKDNGNQFVEIHGSRGLHSNVTVQKLDAPYLLAGSIGLHQKLTILPGVTMQFFTDAGINMDAQYEGSGTFIANGTASDPITFVGYKAGKGVWLGLSLGNGDPENVLNYCVVDGAGSNIPNGSTACVGDVKGAINFFPSCNTTVSKPVATNCTVTNSGGYGIIYRKGAIVNFSKNTYSGNSADNEKAF